MLDINQLRSAFLLSETLTERIRRFRENRISKVYANETPIPILSNPIILIHFIPLSSFSPGQNIDVGKIACKLWNPIYSSHNLFRYNIDGYLTYEEFGKERKGHTYIQVFRNGIIECVESYILKSNNNEKF